MKEKKTPSEYPTLNKMYESSGELNEFQQTPALSLSCAIQSGSYFTFPTFSDFHWKLVENIKNHLHISPLAAPYSDSYQNYVFHSRSFNIEISFPRAPLNADKES